VVPLKRSVSPLALGWAFLKLGISTFGGAASAAIGDEVVRRRGWLTYDEFLTFRSIAMIAPGANSPNLSVLIGRHLGGPLGAAAAFTAATIPGVVTILVFGILALNPKLGLSAALRGFAAAAVGLSFANAIEMTAVNRRDVFKLAIVAATAATVLMLHLSLGVTFAIFVPIAIAINLAKSPESPPSR
jgi:chromate transport protein ChrA